MRGTAVATWYFRYDFTQEWVETHRAIVQCSIGPKKVTFYMERGKRIQIRRGIRELEVLPIRMIRRFDRFEKIEFTEIKE